MFLVNQEILERKCGMEPRVYTSEDINDLAHMVQEEYEESVKDDVSVDASLSRDIEIIEDQRAQRQQSPDLKFETKFKGGNSSVSVIEDIEFQHKLSGFTETDLELHVVTSVSNTPGVGNSSYASNSNTGTDNDFELSDNDVNDKNKNANENSTQNSGHPKNNQSSNQISNQSRSTVESIKSKITQHIHFGQESSTMLHRLTKQMDRDGRFRITVRSSVSGIRVIKNIILNSLLMTSVIIWPDWWYDHIWVQNPKNNIFSTNETCIFIIRIILFMGIKCITLWSISMVINCTSFIC